MLTPYLTPMLLAGPKRKKGRRVEREAAAGEAPQADDAQPTAGGQEAPAQHKKQKGGAREQQAGAGNQAQQGKPGKQPKEQEQAAGKKRKQEAPEGEAAAPAPKQQEHAEPGQSKKKRKQQQQQQQQQQEGDNKTADEPVQSGHAEGPSAGKQAKAKPEGGKQQQPTQQQQQQQQPAAKESKGGKKAAAAEAAADAAAPTGGRQQPKQQGKESKQQPTKEPKQQQSKQQPKEAKQPKQQAQQPAAPAPAAAPAAAAAPASGGKSSLLEKMKARLAGGRFRSLNESMYTCSGEEALGMMKVCVRVCVVVVVEGMCARVCLCAGVVGSALLFMPPPGGSITCTPLLPLPLPHLQKDPSLFSQYHEGFRAQTQGWPAQPVELAARWLKVSFRRTSAFIPYGAAPGPTCTACGAGGTLAQCWWGVLVKALRRS